MFYFFLFSLSALMIVGGLEENKKCSNNESNYPSGFELKRQLRNTIIYDYDITSLNYDLIEEYIFRNYVYNFEKISGYTRDVAIRKALDKYVKTYGILKY